MPIIYKFVLVTFIYSVDLIQLHICKLTPPIPRILSYVVYRPRDLPKSADRLLPHSDPAPAAPPALCLPGLGRTIQWPSNCTALPRAGRVAPPPPCIATIKRDCTYKFSCSVYDITFHIRSSPALTHLQLRQVLHGLPDGVSLGLLRLRLRLLQSLTGGSDASYFSSAVGSFSGCGAAK